MLLYLTSGQRIFVKGHIACCAVIEEWMIPFDVMLFSIEWSLSLLAITDDWLIPFGAYTAAETPNPIQWAS